MRLSSASALNAFFAPAAKGTVVHLVLFNLQLRKPSGICSDPLRSRVFSFAVRDLVSQTLGVDLARVLKQVVVCVSGVAAFNWSLAR